MRANAGLPGVVSERGTEVRTLAEEVSHRAEVSDAWTAKHFSDRLLVVEVPPEEGLPDTIRKLLHEHGLREANEVYDLDASDADYAGELILPAVRLSRISAPRGAEYLHEVTAGSITGARRYRFVDVREREQLQSYVVD